MSGGAPLVVSVGIAVPLRAVVEVAPALVVAVNINPPLRAVVEVSS